MKLNWNTFKVVFALVIVIGTIFWALNSVRPLYYSGTNLNFGVGSGPVTVTNPSDQPVPVQLVSVGTRSFSVLSTIEGVSGSSTRVGSGSTATQLLEFDLPLGVSEFTVVRGGHVNFVVNTDNDLVATVHPLTESVARTTLIVAGVVVLGALFYISRAIDHSWISVLGGKRASIKNTPPTSVVPDGGQGDTPRSYGDSRGNI